MKRKETGCRVRCREAAEKTDGKEVGGIVTPVNDLFGRTTTRVVVPGRNAGA